MTNTLVSDVVKAHSMGDQRGYVVDVKCPLCSLAHQFYVTLQSDYYHKSPTCEAGKSNRLLKFKFNDAVLADLATSKVETSG